MYVNEMKFNKCQLKILLFTKDNGCKLDNHNNYSKKIDKIQMVPLAKLNHLVQNVCLQQDICPKINFKINVRKQTLR